nr:F-box protein PP2-B15-like [Ipomoea batatas]
MVMKMAEGAFGLDVIPCEMSVAVGNDEETTGGTTNIKEKLKLRVNGGGEERQLRERGDGWMEIEVGEFFTGEENEGEVTMRLTEVNGEARRQSVVRGTALRGNVALSSTFPSNHLLTRRCIAARSPTSTSTNTPVSTWPALNTRQRECMED